MDQDRAQDTKWAPLRDRWRYFAANERNPARRSFRYESWQLLDGNYRYEVVRRGAFFDAEKNGVIVDRFTELEAAQRCIEERAERPLKKRGQRPKERDSENA
jgi:hypothetical protein